MSVFVSLPFFSMFFFWKILKSPGCPGRLGRQASRPLHAELHGWPSRPGRRQKCECGTAMEGPRRFCDRTNGQSISFWSSRWRNLFDVWATRDAGESLLPRFAFAWASGWQHFLLLGRSGLEMVGDLSVFPSSERCSKAFPMLRDPATATARTQNYDICNNKHRLWREPLHGVQDWSRAVLKKALILMEKWKNEIPTPCFATLMMSWHAYDIQRGLSASRYAILCTARMTPPALSWDSQFGSVVDCGVPRWHWFLKFAFYVIIFMMLVILLIE